MFSFLSGASPTVFADLPTVKDAQDCLAIVEPTFQKLQEITNAPDWVPLAYTDVEGGEEGIKLYDRTVANSTVSYGKGTVIINIAPKILFEKMWEFNFEWVKTFDVDMKEFTRLIEVNPEIMLTRVRANAPFPVTPREFILVRARKEVDGTFYIFSSSVNYEASPVDATYVRGVIPANGFIFKAVEGDPNKTLLTRITAVDPKGSIPLWVIDMVKAKAGDYLVKLRKEAAN